MERIVEEVDAAHVFDAMGLGFLQAFDGLYQLVAYVGYRGCHQRQPAGLIAGPLVHRPGQIQQAEPRRGQIGHAVQVGNQRSGRLQQSVAVSRSYNDHLAVPKIHVARLTGCGLWLRFFQHHMGVDAAEAEGVDAGSPRCFVALDPGARLGVQVEIGTFQTQLGVRVLTVNRGRQHLMVQRQRRLDDPGHAGSRHRVADHRLDGAQRAVRHLALTLAEHSGQRLNLGGIAHEGSRAVGLDQANGCRIYAGVFIGHAQRQHLTLQPRRQHTHGPAVAGRSDTFDDRVYSIAVAQGILLAFQHQHADSLGEDRAVGAFIKGPYLFLMRERAQL